MTSDKPAIKDKHQLVQDWLPAIYRDTDAERLLDIIGGMFARLHGVIDQLPASTDPLSVFFDPPAVGPDDAALDAKRREYLTWFAGWVNLVISDEWTYEQQRQILARILPIYRKRGTREGLAEYLKIYAGGEISIEDDRPPIQVGQPTSDQVGVNMIIGGFPPATESLQVAAVSEIGSNAVIDGFPPYFFIVRAAVSASGPQALIRKRKAITAVLEMEKPAHTWYHLTVKGPTFKVGDKTTATVGMNTII
jgi:phage tail-like protein